jgi:hypothetical protein
MPVAGGFLVCIRALSFLFVCWKTIGVDDVSGDHEVHGMKISSLPRWPMSSSSPELVRLPRTAHALRMFGYIGMGSVTVCR